MNLLRQIVFILVLLVHFVSFGQRIVSEKDFNQFFETVLVAESIELSKEQKQELKTYVRKEPEHFISVLNDKNLLAKVKRTRVKNYLYSLLTIAHYNLGDLKKASYYNQQELEGFKDYNYNLVDSLRAFSNKIILFYSLDQPTDALKSAVTLHKRLINFEFNEDVVVLYRQLATIYSLLQFNNEAFDVLEFVIDKAKSKGKEAYLDEIYITIAYFHLSLDQSELAHSYLEKAEAYIKENPYLHRKVLAGYASLFNLKGDYEKSNFYYQSTIKAFKEYPDVISLARILKDYLFFLRDFSEFVDIEFLQGAFNYIKKYENVDLLEFEKNIIEIDLGIRYLKNEFNTAYADLVSKRDSVNALLHQMNISFVQSNIDFHYQDKINVATLEQLKLEKKNSTNKINFLYLLSISLGVLLVLLVLFLSVFRKNQKNKSKLREKEVEITREKLSKQELQNKQLKAEKENAMSYVQFTAKQISKQKGLLSRLEHVIQEVKKTKDYNESVRILQNFNNESKEFLNGVFEEEIISNFKISQKNKYETLKANLGNDTSSEFLLAVLYTIGFNTKECSVSLGKSEKAIRSLRYRLRKQLDLDTETDLKSYLDGL